MDLIRALRILRHRWLLVAAILVATTAVAVVTATYRNDSIEPVSRAEAPITFISDVSDLDSGGNQGGGSGGGSPLMEIVQAQIEEAREWAVSVNADLLEDPRNEIVADPTLGKLTFIARSDDPQEAVATAAEMRRRLINRQPVDMESQIQEQLNALTERMAVVRTELLALLEEYSLSPEQSARKDHLTNLLSQLEAQALDLERQILVPDEDPEAEKTPEELSAELETVNEAIETVQAELATIPNPLQEFSEEQTVRGALERQYRELEASYQDLILQQEELSGPPVVELVDVFDESPDRISRRVAAAVALLFGAGLVLLVLLVYERLIRPVWFLEDVPQVSRLGTVAPRLPSPLPWYLQVGESPRKAAVQTLRSSLRARARGRELVVGVCGAGIHAEAVQHLAADLAVSYASTQAATTLVNADFESRLSTPELEGAVMSLGFIAAHDFTGEEMVDMIDDASDRQRSVHPNLLPIVSGDDIGVPADALATPQLGRLFATLRETQEVVVVMCSDISDATTRAALDRTDLVVIVTEPGRTTQPTLLRVLEEMSVRDIDPALVMVKKQVLRRSRRLVAAVMERAGRYPWPSARKLAARAESATRVVLGWVKGLSTRNLRGTATVLRRGDSSSPATPRESAKPSGPIVRVIAADTQVALAVDASDLDHPDAMLKLLDRSDPAADSDRVESFLTSWVTRIVEARPGTGLDATTMGEVTSTGFVPLSSWKDNPSIAHRLRHEFRRILGRKDAASLEKLVLRSLRNGVSMPGLDLDGWVERHYFKRHIALTNGEPSVWHITSPRGTVSALIAAEHLDVQRIERFVEGVVIRSIERLARRQRFKELMGANPVDLVDQMEDVRSLGLSLAWLMDGSHADARLWYPTVPEDKQPHGWQPDWQQGITLNIAPLQRLGMLPVPVLTEQELKTLDPTG